MSIFSNSFFSVAGQKERLSNVVNTLAIAVNPFSKDKITANISNPILKASTEFVANNPYTTAGLAVGAGAIAKTGVSTIASASLKTQVITATTGLVATGAAVGNPKIIAPVIKGVSQVTPESILKYSASASSVKSTTDLKDLVISNPVLTGVVAVTSAVVAGKAITTGANIYNAYETRKNTKIISENTEAMLKDAVSKNIIASNPSDLPIVSTPPTPVIPKAVSASNGIEGGSSQAITPRKKRLSRPSILSKYYSERNIYIGVAT